ncbi:hypothetical protein EIP86_006213 [Pleurotus ostreatoroseus]|nr:hypothetical protein EIP86_006213 [Pleurotus ostreatoroseus]
MAQPKALILLADGTEEMEFTITYDTLVRAGVACTSAYVPAQDSGEGTPAQSPPFARGSRGINILPDTYFSPQDATPDTYDLLVIPGGAKGAETMSGSSPVQHLVRRYLEEGKYVGMVCADFEYKDEPVVVSGKLVTSRGPGTSFPFALTLVELLCGKEKRKQVADPMVFPPGTFA